MIVSLRGRLLQKDSEGAVVECAGVGYGVAMSLSALARLGEEGSDVHVLVHTQMSQDALRLFGFLEQAERQAFGVLLGTAGVGPKLALAILSTLSADELAAAVARGDKGALTGIPGVGQKKAARLLVELKDRLPKVLVPVAHPGDGDALADVVSALVNLGFQERVAQSAARYALEQLPGERGVARLVREALRATTHAATNQAA